jgi:hypothetical protein
MTDSELPGNMELENLADNNKEKEESRNVTLTQPCLNRILFISEEEENDEFEKMRKEKVLLNLNSIIL